MVSAHAYTDFDANLAINAKVDILEHVGLYKEKTFDKIKDNGIIIVPTFIAAKDSLDLPCNDILDDFNDDIAVQWYFEEKSAIPKLHKKGIMVALGCDSGFYGTPFSSLVREIIALNSVTNIPMEDIMFWCQMNTPLTLGEDSRIGAIKVGNWADYIIYDENPVIYPHVLESPKEVWIKGKCVLNNENYIQEIKKS